MRESSATEVQLTKFNKQVLNTETEKRRQARRGVLTLNAEEEVGPPPMFGAGTLTDGLYMEFSCWGRGCNFRDREIRTLLTSQTFKRILYTLHALCCYSFTNILGELQHLYWRVFNQLVPGYQQHLLKLPNKEI